MVRSIAVPTPHSLLVAAILMATSCTDSTYGPGQAAPPTSSSDAALRSTTTPRSTIEPFTVLGGCKNGLFYAATPGVQRDTVLIVYYVDWLEQRTNATEAIDFNFALPDERVSVVIQSGPGVAGSPFCIDAVPPGIEVLEETRVTSGAGSVYIAAPEFESENSFASQVCVSGSFTLAGGRTADGRAVPEINIVTDLIGCGYGG